MTHKRRHTGFTNTANALDRIVITSDATAWAAAALLEDAHYECRFHRLNEADRAEAAAQKARARVTLPTLKFGTK